MEKQSIYFAPANAEDDIYEGRYPMYFEGDESLWQGLFAMLYKHISFNQGICGEEYNKYLPAFVPVKTELTSRNYNYEGEELKGYLSLKTVSSLVKLLAVSGKVYENQLRKILIQYVVFLTVFYSQRLGAKINGDDQLEKKEDRMLKKLDSVEVMINKIYKLPFDKSRALDFLLIGSKDPLYYQSELDADSQAFTNYQVVEKLMDTFFKGLRDIALEKCYIASFTDNCLDGRMWHDYTNYQGIAIEYKDDSSMELRDSEGHLSNHKFRKVEYKEAKGFNFFSSIGKLPAPMITGMLAKYDWKNDKYRIEKNLKDNYWKWTEQTVLTKDFSWSMQREYRLIISDFMEGYSTITSRTFYYNFSELKSVTFGPRTSSESKVKIAKILTQKCKENEVSNFPVYSVFRDDKTRKLKREIVLTLNRSHK